VIVLNKLDAALSFHQNALRVRGQRQELIAANIANADTPNFKARDIDFKTAMQSATAGINREAFMANKTSAMHLDGIPSNNTSLGGGPGDALFRPIIQGSVDGNTVDMDVERNQFADNGIRYEASLTMINSQLKKMLAAIQG
jgi:flagellar basal-body rod protein FlgB